MYEDLRPGEKTKTGRRIIKYSQILTKEGWEDDEGWDYLDDTAPFIQRLDKFTYAIWYRDQHYPEIKKGTIEYKG